MKNFIVFDLEWNQNPGGKELSVERLPFEIFEIGAVKLNEEREKTGEFHRIIRPCVYRQMHRIISEVTHVSIEELERGRSRVLHLGEYGPYGTSEEHGLSRDDNPISETTPFL